MKLTKKLLSLLLASVMSIGTVQAEDLLAFPEAAGWGRFAKGARTSSSPTVYHVTNLNDSGSGSLRDAVSQGNRIIVFDVSGVIKISSRIVFSSNIYVAGQTAPGEGVTVYGNGVSFSGASNIICRYLRIRMGHGGDSGKDCAGISRGTNMIFDHCSFSWGLDETFSINPDGGGDLHSITLMNCIFGQGLMTHSAGGLMQTDSVTLYRNLYIDNSTRNNKVKGRNQYVNNVVYNWSNGCYIMGGDSEGQSYCNIESNLFINGPAKGGSALGGGNSNFHFYGEDNWQDSNMDGIFDPQLVTTNGGSDRVSMPFPYPELDRYPGDQLLELNIPTVGASLPYRDQSDCYMIDELMSLGKKGALISNEANLPIGAPSTWAWWSGTKLIDTDNDGMPDEWEKANGTNPNVNDATVKATNGYLNIENYINSITVDDRQFFLRRPITLEASKSTTSTITLSWRDYTYEENGFAIEVAEDGSSDYREVGRTTANATSFVVTDLADGKFYNIRVRAFGKNAGADAYSEYATGRFSTRPVEVDVVDIDTYQPDVTLGTAQTVWDDATTDWKEGKAFKAGDKVLLNSVTDQTVTITGTVEPQSVVVNGIGNVTVNGVIGGAATSVNKGNTGTLILNGANTYTGATVAYDGVVEFNSIANGGVASAIGASQNFAQNWVFDGGTYRYTGSNATTDRNAQLKSESTLEVEKNTTTLTMNGSFEGSGSLLNIDGNGTVAIPTTKFFGYTGPTRIKGGTLYLSTVDAAKNGIGSSSKLILAGGTLKTKGESEGYETYSFPIEVEEGTYSYFAPNRNCYFKSKITGAGTFEYTIPYLREYFDPNITEFTGKIVANGQSSDKWGALFMSQGSHKMPTTQVYLKGNAKLCMWTTNGNGYIGGLSGDAGTYLMASSKSTTSAVCNWTIGGSNSDEEFRGIINNNCCASGYNAKSNNITKVGTGAWRLTGKNVYIGTTTVNGGALIVNGNNSGATGDYIVNNEATLSGTGTIGGKITVNKGGILCAGDTVYGKSLTLNAAVTMKAGSTMKVPCSNENNRYSQMNFYMNSSLTIESGAVLEFDLSDVKYIEEGKSFKVFSQCPASHTGEFIISPAKPAEGMKWDISDLFETGIVYAVNENAEPMVYGSVVKYSWESPEGTPVEFGGIASTSNGTKEYVNLATTKNKADVVYHVLSLAGKSANIKDTTPSANASTIRIDFNDPLEINDSLIITGCKRALSGDPDATIYIDFGGKAVVEDEQHFNNIYSGELLPNTIAIRVPDAAKGASYIRMTRNLSNTTLYLTKVVRTSWEKTTDTDIVEMDNVAEDAAIEGEYNLSGQLVGKNFKGLVIMNGKKYNRK